MTIEPAYNYATDYTAQARTWSDAQISKAVGGEFPTWVDPKIAAQIDRTVLLDTLHERAAVADQVARDVLDRCPSAALAEMVHTTEYDLGRAHARRLLATRALHDNCLTWETVRAFRAESGKVGVQFTGLSGVQAVSALMVAGFRSVTFDKTDRTVTALNLRDVSA